MKLSKLNIILVALLMLALAYTPCIQAAPNAPQATAITFTFDAGDDGQATIVKTVGGVTLTISDGTCNGSPRDIGVDGDGIGFETSANCNGGGFQGVDSLRMSFDSAVAFQSYEITYERYVDSGTFVLTTPRGISAGNPLLPTGTYNFNDYLTVEAGEVITLTPSMTGDDPLSQINNITVLIPTTTAQSISNGGASATVENVQITNNSTNACEFTVTHAPIPAGYGNPGPGEMPLQWDITTDGNCGTLDVDLAFNYTDDELAVANNVTEGNLVAFRHASGTSWTNEGGVVDTGANTVTLSNVDSLSDWTLGDPTTSGNDNPTAITLNGIIAHGGMWAGGMLLALCALIVLWYKPPA